MADLRKRKKWFWLIPAIVLILFCLIFLLYTQKYYTADESVHAVLQTDETVTVVKEDYGWLFDGPSDQDALIFYPGGKVEETAYAPFLHKLAENGMDVFLVRMPFRLAVFGRDKADRVTAQYDYARWYIGGHSLGGVMAASYAATHGSLLSGVFLLAAYPVKPLDDNMRAVLIYGSEDGVLDREKLKAAARYLPDGSEIYVIEGGNHAQFGNYGAQNGDGNALISSDEQQRRTTEIILQNK